MPTSTYIPLATTTLASSTSSVTFSSLPSSYRDIVLIFTVPATSSTLGNILVRINSDGGTNYTFIETSGNGSTTSSYTNTVRTGAYIGYHPGGNPVFTCISQIMDYSATDKQKTLLTRNNQTTAAGMITTRWANTAAITQLQIFGDNANMPIGSVISLYAIVS